MLTAAVIGCGYWGPNIIRNLYYNNKVNLKYVVDFDHKRLEYITNLYPNITPLTNINTVLTDDSVDFVAIVTPINTHFDLISSFLLNNKHVFVEKPLCTSYSDALKIENILNEKKLNLMVGHVFTYNSSVVKIKEIIDSQELGEIQYISSQRLNLGLFNPHYNVVWDLAPHDFSILFYWFDSMPVKIKASGSSHVINGIEDIASLSVELENGISVYLQYSWLDPNKVRKMTVVGSKKMLVYDDVSAIEPIKIFNKGVDIPSYYDTFDAFRCSYRYGDIVIPRIMEVEPLKSELDDFINSIYTGGSTKNGVVPGKNVVKAIEDSIFAMRKE